MKSLRNLSWKLLLFHISIDSPLVVDFKPHAGRTINHLFSANEHLGDNFVYKLDFLSFTCHWGSL